MKLGYLYGGKVKGNVDLGIDPYSGLPSTIRAPGGFLGPMAGVAGNVYYVSHDHGNDANDGLSPQTALKTIQAGLDKCVDFNDDYVLVMPTVAHYGPAAGRIIMDNFGVHLLGLVSNPLGDENLSVYRAAAEANPMLEISGGGNEVAGLEFACNNNAGLRGAVEINGDGGALFGGWNFIHNIRVPGWWELAGIVLWGGGWNVISACLFESLTDGIHIASRVFGADRTTVGPMNKFRGCTNGVRSADGYVNHNAEIGPKNKFCRTNVKAMTYAVFIGNGMDFADIHENDISLAHNAAFGNTAGAIINVAALAALNCDAMGNEFGDGVAFT